MRGGSALTTTRERYERHQSERHRPAHGRRAAGRWAAFLLPHLRPEMRLLDIGCGPGSITVGLGARSIGVDLAPVPVEGVPVVMADGVALPFPDSAFDAIYVNAVLQHVEDPLAVMREARRAARPGAVIGVGDADWGGHLLHPADPLLERGQHIREAMRGTGDVRVGRRLRGLLVAAGFERVELTVTGRAAGTADAVAAMARFEGSWFEAPDVIAYVTELGLSEPDEMAAIAAAWKRWSVDPASCSATMWFTALAWAPPV
jgi:SAM-dependent methyltransferase